MSLGKKITDINGPRFPREEIGESIRALIREFGYKNSDELKKAIAKGKVSEEEFKIALSDTVRKMVAKSLGYNSLVKFDQAVEREEVNLNDVLLAFTEFHTSFNLGVHKEPSKSKHSSIDTIVDA